MRALLQRVSQACVEVEGETVGEIGPGLLVFLAVEQEDDKARADKLLDKVLNYRIFGDSEGKMNLSVRETQGGVLIVSQFTLAADTLKGLRPSFTTAAPPRLAKQLYDYFVAHLRERYSPIATGEFAADMKVALVNDGPVTFLLET